MRKLIVGLVLVLVIATVIWWLAGADRRRGKQFYDCRERVGDNLPAQVECLVYRYGWPEGKATVTVYAAANRRNRAP